jgi:hypothetical protein
MTDTYSITYTARGVTYNLNGYDADHGLTLNYLGDQGFGLAPLHRITTRGPLQHGDSDIDFRLDPRILQIPLVVKNESASPMFNSYAIREALLNIFRPQDVGVLSVVRSDGVTTYTRSIIVKVLGGLTFDVDPVDYHVRTVVQLRADDPTWYDPVVTTRAVTNAVFGINVSYTQSGNWYSYPIIEVTGPVTNFSVIGFTTGIIKVNSGVTIAAGVTWYFDLRYGYKTVYTGPDQTGTNVIGEIDPTSTLSTFTMLPGTNSIMCTGGGRTAATIALFKYNSRYTGI